MRREVTEVESLALNYCLDLQYPEFRICQRILIGGFVKVLMPPEYIVQSLVGPNCCTRLCIGAEVPTVAWWAVFLAYVPTDPDHECRRIDTYRGASKKTEEVDVG